MARRAALSVIGLPEGGALVEQVCYHTQGDQSKGDPDHSAGDYVVGVVEVVADAGEADPEGKGDHAKLDEGPEDLERPVDNPDWSVLRPWEVGQPGLEGVDCYGCNDDESEVGLWKV